MPLDYYRQLRKFKGKDWIEVELDEEQIDNSGAYSLLSFAEDELDIELAIRKIEEKAKLEEEKLARRRRLEHSLRKKFLLDFYSRDLKSRGVVTLSPDQVYAEQKKAFVIQRIQRATIRRLIQEKESMLVQRETDMEKVEDVYLKHSLALAILAAVGKTPKQPNAQQLEELE